MHSSRHLPLGLDWEIEPQSWDVEGGAMTVLAAGPSDNSVDPAGSVVVCGDGFR
jgi:hypothetical protein